MQTSRRGGCRSSGPTYGAFAPGREQFSALWLAVSSSLPFQLPLHFPQELFSCSPGPAVKVIGGTAAQKLVPCTWEPAMSMSWEGGVPPPHRQCPPHGGQATRAYATAWSRTPNHHVPQFSPQDRRFTLKNLPGLLPFHLHSCLRLYRQPPPPPRGGGPSQLVRLVPVSHGFQDSKSKLKGRPGLPSSALLASAKDGAVPVRGRTRSFPAREGGRLRLPSLDSVSLHLAPFLSLSRGCQDSSVTPDLGSVLPAWPLRRVAQVETQLRVPGGVCCICCLPSDAHLRHPPWLPAAGEAPYGITDQCGAVSQSHQEGVWTLML